MGRKVKLMDTGEIGDSSINYKAENGKYYTSENAYLKFKKNAEYRTMCTQKMFDILGYKDRMKIPSLFFKKLSEWDVYGYDVVLNCMCGEERNCDWALKNKQFNQETGKIMYLCMIFENHMMDYYKQKKRQEKQEQIAEIKVIANVDDIDMKHVDNKSSIINNLLGDI